jgi:pimeloyl-ACP methyl ester carboxylesterase
MAMSVSILKWLIVLLLAGYIGGIALLFFKQRDLLFPIPRGGRVSPQAAGFAQAEEQVLESADGERVIVWHVPPQPGHSVVLFFHGNGDFLAGRVARFRGIISDGTGLVALSYRGYAGSTGHPSERGLLMDAAAAYAFAIARYKPDQIVVWGFSLGTGVAVALAADHPIGKLILEGPYTSTADVASTLPMMRAVPVRWLMRDQFASDRRIARVTAPLLVMHGDRDPVIPVAQGERLFALAREPKQLVRFSQGGHENLDTFGALETAHRFIDGANG